MGRGMTVIIEIVINIMIVKDAHIRHDEDIACCIE